MVIAQTDEANISVYCCNMSYNELHLLFILIYVIYFIVIGYLR